MHGHLVPSDDEAHQVEDEDEDPMTDETDTPQDEPEVGPEDDGWDDRLKDSASAFRKKFGKRVRSVFNEDVIRGAVADAVPTELFGYVMKQADSAKDEVVRITGVQIRKFLENLDIGGELQKVLTAVSFEVRTTVRFVPNEESNMVTPDSEVSMALKKGGKEVEVNASPKKVKAMREGLRGAVDGVMKTFAGDEEEEGEVKKRWNAMRTGLFAAVDTVVGAFDRDDEDEEHDDAPSQGDDGANAGAQDQRAEASSDADGSSEDQAADRDSVSAPADKASAKLKSDSDGSTPEAGANDGKDD